MSPFIIALPDVTIPPPPESRISFQPIPVGIVPEDMRLPRDVLGDALPLTTAGVSTTFVSAWMNQASDDNSLFYLGDRSIFQGQFRFRSQNLPASEILFTCLSDGIQIPCDGEAKPLQIFSLTPIEEINIPIEIQSLGPGLHDLVALFWLDPFQDTNDLWAESRSVNTVLGLRTSIAVDPVSSQPEIDYPDLSTKPVAAFGIDGIAISLEPDPLDRYGAFPYIYSLQGKTGQALDLYLHLNNKHLVGVDYAIFALIDYEQMPIVWRGQRYMPLNVHVKADAWEAAAITIQAPDIPGRYELQFVGIPFPYARMDLAGEAYYGKYYPLPLPVYFPASTRILLEITD